MILAITPFSWWKTLNFLSFSPSLFSLTSVSLVSTAVQSLELQHNCVRHVEAVGLPIKLAKVHLLVIRRLLCHKRFSCYRKSLVPYKQVSKMSAFSPLQNHILSKLWHFSSLAYFCRQNLSKFPPPYF